MQCDLLQIEAFRGDSHEIGITTRVDDGELMHQPWERVRVDGYSRVGGQVTYYCTTLDPDDPEHLIVEVFRARTETGIGIVTRD